MKNTESRTVRLEGPRDTKEDHLPNEHSLSRGRTVYSLAGAGL